MLMIRTSHVLPIVGERTSSKRCPHTTLLHTVVFKANDLRPIGYELSFLRDNLLINSILGCATLANSHSSPLGASLSSYINPPRS